MSCEIAAHIDRDIAGHQGCVGGGRVGCRGPVGAGAVEVQPAHQARGSEHSKIVAPAMTSTGWLMRPGPMPTRRRPQLMTLFRETVWRRAWGAGG